MLWQCKDRRDKRIESFNGGNVSSEKNTTLSCFELFYLLSVLTISEILLNELQNMNLWAFFQRYLQLRNYFLVFNNSANLNTSIQKLKARVEHTRE